MTTEGRSAPRIPPGRDSLAGSAAAARIAPSLGKTISEWKTDGVTPFGPSPTDGAEGLLKQARGVAVVLESAWLDSHDLYRKSGVGSDNLTTLNPEYHAYAMAGISSLINLSLLMIEGAE